MLDIHCIDILEDKLEKRYPGVLDILLTDHTMSEKDKAESGNENCVHNIFWATNDYTDRGAGYDFNDQITRESLLNTLDRVIVPRVMKTEEKQKARSTDMAEVFTPAWICNAQINLVDNAWFGYDNPFNTPVDNNPYDWQPTASVNFDRTNKSWKKYLNDPRIEVTCGEAPYLCSRYDATTGRIIPLNKRIGVLDRKLRVVNENCPGGKDNYQSWKRASLKAVQSVYGYDWQGDNVFLARKTMLFTYYEYYLDKWGEEPSKRTILDIAEVISWNIWQMDGLKFVIPNSCHPIIVNETEDNSAKECPGCKNNDPFKHNGIRCIIKEWKHKDPDTPNGVTVEFISVLKKPMKNKK